MRTKRSIIVYRDADIEIACDSKEHTISNIFTDKMGARTPCNCAVVNWRNK